MHGRSGDDGIDALVHAAGLETAYRRAGGGPAVVLLVADGAASALGAALLGGLAPDFRVIAPRAAPAPGGRVRLGHAHPPTAALPWLRNVIDAIGLDRPALVADAAFAPLALRFARRDAERAGRLVLLLDGTCRRRAGDDAARVLRTAPTPLPAALAELRRFLR